MENAISKIFSRVFSDFQSAKSENLLWRGACDAIQFTVYSHLLCKTAKKANKLPKLFVRVTLMLFFFYFEYEIQNVKSPTFNC